MLSVSKKTAGNELMNIITIFLGFSVGCTTNAATFLNIQTVEIIVLGIVAFGVGTAGGVLLGKVMCFVTHGKINPLIAPPVFPLFPWPPVFPRKSARNTTPATTCSCTPWVPTLPVLSVPLSPPAS